MRERNHFHWLLPTAIRENQQIALMHAHDCISNDLPKSSFEQHGQLRPMFLPFIPSFKGDGQTIKSYSF